MHLVLQTQDVPHQSGLISGLYSLNSTYTGSSNLNETVLPHMPLDL